MSTPNPDLKPLGPDDTLSAAFQRPAPVAPSPWEQRHGIVPELPPLTPRQQQVARLGRWQAYVATLSAKSQERYADGAIPDWFD
jgi:hypothetical protein